MNVFFYLFFSALQAHCYLKEQIFNLVTLTGYFFFGQPNLHNFVVKWRKSVIK